MPSWVGRLPHQVGYPAGGSLSADEYKALVLVYCPLVVCLYKLQISFVYHLPTDPSYLEGMASSSPGGLQEAYYQVGSTGATAPPAHCEWHVNRGRQDTQKQAATA